MEELLEQILLLKEVLSLIKTSDDEHESETESESESEHDNELELVYDSESDYIDDGPYRKRRRT
jgi:hypothetical protein